MAINRDFKEVKNYFFIIISMYFFYNYYYKKINYQ